MREFEETRRQPRGWRHPEAILLQPVDPLLQPLGPQPLLIDLLLHPSLVHRRSKLVLENDGTALHDGG